MVIPVQTEAPSSPVLARRVERIVAAPQPEPGFIGEGHLAVEVLRPREISTNDPFVLLMDDRLEIAKRRQLGGPHPHAGLETVTLVLEGSVSDRDEGELSAGDAVWMTAGRGIVHNEYVEAEGKVRILQLWIGLPAQVRFAEPALQVIRAASVPVQREQGATVRLYSGRSGTLRSSTRNLVPITLAGVELDPDSRLELELPASHTGFLYVIGGSLRAGSEAAPARSGDVAWLDRPTATGTSRLSLSAGKEGARALLYAGKPHSEALVQHGPFVGDTEATITRFFQDYRSGRFQHLSTLAHG